MKSIKTLLLFIIFPLFLHAQQLAYDTFSNGSTDGWSNAYTYNDDGLLYINRDTEAYKIYDFGTNYSNTTLYIEMYVYMPDDWESGGRTKDYFYIKANDETIETFITDGGYATINVEATTDSSGKLKLSLLPDSTANDEWAAIDYVSIKDTPPISNADWRDFSLRYNRVFKGELTAIGNAFVVHPQNYTSTTCDSYTDGPFVDPVESNNKYWHYCHYNVDGEQGKAATTAQLLLPEGAKIIWAGLYWQALTPSKSSYENLTIEIRKDDDSSGYHLQTATHVDYQSQYTDNIDPVGSSSGASSADLYSAFADVTALFEQNSWGEGNYTVRTPDVMEGQEGGFGVYGAWNLVIIYKDPNSTYKSFSVFDGWKEISSSNSDVEVKISGFYTPQVTPIYSNITFFAAEGDYNINGDKLKALRQSDNQLVEFLNQNNPNDTDQTFSSYVHTTGARNPAQQNNNGIDIQSFAIGSNTEYNLLETGQTELEFHFTSTGDLYFPSVLAFATEVYAPRFCYDYTYGQNGYFQTAPSIKPARIEGTFSSDPINVKLYFKNLENSDIIVSDLTVNIDPIEQNTTYKPDSTYITKPGSSLQEFVSDTNRDTAPDRDNNISIGDLGPLQYFYTYYSLNHENANEINASLNAYLDFNLTLNVNGEIIDLGRNSLDIADMDPCTLGYYAYEPAPGRFNIVHSSQQNDSLSSKYYFNLPTQVVNRYDDNFIAESMDPNDLNTTQSISTIAALEMVDMSGFHYTSATCTDNNASVISNARVWVLFDDSDTAQILGSDLQSKGFLARASQNAAFRLSYNAVDENGTIIFLEKENNGDYKIINWQTRWEGDDCVVDMVSNGNGDDNRVASYCNATGNNPNDLATCMECLYGYNTPRMCSRDNFAIRPEALYFEIVDHNQTNPAQKTKLLDNNGSTLKTEHLAAGYNYYIDAKATDHNNNTGTPGYTTTAVDANLTWSETTPVVCNNEANISIDISFINGSAESNKTWNDVGIYTLHLQDKLWSRVDWQAESMTHHTSPYFSSAKDCIEDESTVVSVTSNQKNGCNISSIHTNVDNSHELRDMQIIYHPYTFDLNGSSGAAALQPSFGANFNTLDTNSFIYYADINNSNDENISYHINGTIAAVGKNSVILSNFTDGCYAKPLKLSIVTSDRTLQDSSGANVAYIARFHDLNTTGGIVDTQDINYSNATTPAAAVEFNTNATHFFKALSGKMKTRINMNYKRTKDKTINPKELSFFSFKAECADPANECTFAADLDTNKTTKATLDLNSSKTLKHYYGRAHAPSERFVGADGNATLYFEVFCYGTTCNKALLQDGNNSLFSDDPRWFINSQHTLSDGVINSITQKNASKIDVSALIQTTGKVTIPLQYDQSSGYPYRATMLIDTDAWLIYNRYNPNALNNEFDVEFINAAGNWAGVRETNTTTKRNASDITNRRTLW